MRELELTHNQQVSHGLNDHLQQGCQPGGLLHQEDLQSWWGVSPSVLRVVGNTGASPGEL